MADIPKTDCLFWRPVRLTGSIVLLPELIHLIFVNVAEMLLTKKPTAETVGFFNVLLVKVMGIEPMSESISTEASPSAACILSFASDIAYRQAISSAIPSFPRAAGHSHEVFLYILCR